MAHAMGGLYSDDGNIEIYNNHAVALQNSINNGYKIIELDLILTSDEKLVCSHGWKKQTYNDTGVKYNSNEPIMSYDRFMNTKIQGKYKTMDVYDWKEYVINNPNILWEVDLRTISYYEASVTAEKLCEAFDYNSELLNRMLIQVGSKDMYMAFSETFDFKYYQYFIHKSELSKIDSILKFCKKHNFAGMAVNSNYMTKERIDKIHNSNMKVLCYTVDDIKQAKKYINMGGRLYMYKLYFTI